MNNEKWNTPGEKSWQAILVESIREDRIKDLREISELVLQPKKAVPSKKDRRTKIQILMDQLNEAIEIVRKDNEKSWSAGYQTDWNRGAQAGASMVFVKLQEIIKRDKK